MRLLISIDELMAFGLWKDFLELRNGDGRPDCGYYTYELNQYEIDMLFILKLKV